MKFMQKVKSLFVLLAVIFSVSCSLLDGGKEASVTFTIDKATASKIAGAASSRSTARALTAGEMEGLFFEIELKGGYAAKETLPVTEGASVTFTDIPAETKVYAEATAYKIENDEKQILYTGRSEEITIQEGENSLSLVMRKYEPVEPEDPAEPEPTEPKPTEPEDPVEPTEPTEPTEYTITFVLDGGQWKEGYTAPASCTEGEKLAEPEEPSKASSETASYVFEGWYTSADGGETLSETPYDFDSPVTTELTLYAKWKEVPFEPVEPAEPEPTEPEPTEYTITFVLDGGQWNEGYTAPASCTEGEKLAEPGEPSKASSETSSYVFEGWYTSADEGETLSETPYDFDSPVTTELTLYAKWKEVPFASVSAVIEVGESSDISVAVEKDETNIDKGIIIYTFTADEGYESYTWKLDGEEVTATSSVQNTFQFSAQNKAAGTYDISLIVKKVVVEATEDTPAQYEYYSYEAHVTVE